MKCLFILLASTALTAAATESAYDSIPTDTIRVIEGAHRLVLTENSQGVTVTVTGKDDEPGFSYSYQSQFSPDATVHTSQQSNNWRLTLPFSRRAKPTSKYPHSACIVGGLAFGGVSVPGISSKMRTSWEIMLLNAIAFEHRFTPNSRLSIGIGIDWRNYRLDENLRFSQADNGAISISTYGEEVSKPLSRIKTFSWLVPAIYQQRLYRDFWLNAGAILSINSHASLLTRYHNAQGKHEQSSDNIRQNVITCDFLASINYSWLGFYVKYSPCHVLRSSTGLEFRSLSAGLILAF
ncbi:MAG: hypothetical protein PUD91_01790 [Bacteroidales bacterium]|nr:hypothetical protein [Bacteroidales bacterium]